jgi:fatty-acyl-CoA synthase
MDESELSRLTIGSLLDRQGERFGDRDCIAYAHRDTRYTYRQFRERVDLAARGLMAVGVRKGEHVAVWAPNIPEWLMLQYAIAKVGAILVPINTSYRAAELEFLLHNSETTTLFFSAGKSGVDFRAELHAVVPEVDSAPVGHARLDKLPRLARFFFIGTQRLPGMLRFDDLFDLAAQTYPDDLRRRGEALASYEVILLQYSSGTTGSPKGAMLTHRNLIMNGWHVTGRERLTENDRVCFPVPLCHSFGASGASIGSVLRGACMVPVETNEPVAVLEAISQQRCTALYGSPSVFTAVLECQEFDAFDLTSLRTGVVGAAPVPVDVVRSAMDRMHARELTIAYGATEASPVITQTSPDDSLERRLYTVGRSLPGIQLKVVDPQTGSTVSPGTIGELCCRGHGVMKGYFKDAPGTAAAIDAEGWLHTRDLAAADADGFVNIAGRLLETIIREGEKIYPREIEAFLHSHPDIADVHVVGVPNRAIGEDVCAVVKTKPGVSLSEADVIAFCSGRIQDHKVPTLVMFVRDFPLTAGGKVNKYALRQMAIERFGRQGDAAVVTA